MDKLKIYKAKIKKYTHKKTDIVKKMIGGLDIDLQDIDLAGIKKDVKCINVLDIVSCEWKDSFEIEKGQSFKMIKLYKILIVTMPNEETITFKYNGTLGTGAYSIVCEYVCRDETIWRDKTIIVKLSDNEINAADRDSTSNTLLIDKIAISAIPERCSQYIVNSKYFELQLDDNKIRSIILMECMDGSLSNLKVDLINSLGTNKKYVITKILICLADALECLREQGLYYTDMKLENILYKIDGTAPNLKLIIKMGDLGSICKQTDMVCVATFPNILHRRSTFTNPNEYDLIYNLFIIWYALYNVKYDINNIYWKSFAKLEGISIEQGIKNLKPIMLKGLEDSEFSKIWSDDPEITPTLKNAKIALTLDLVKYESTRHITTDAPSALPSTSDGTSPSVPFGTSSSSVPFGTSVPFRTLPFVPFGTSSSFVPFRTSSSSVPFGTLQPTLFGTSSVPFRTLPSVPFGTSSAV